MEHICAPYATCRISNVFQLLVQQLLYAVLILARSTHINSICAMYKHFVSSSSAFVLHIKRREWSIRVYSFIHTGAPLSGRNAYLYNYFANFSLWVVPSKHQGNKNRDFVIVVPYIHATGVVPDAGLFLQNCWLPSASELHSNEQALLSMSIFLWRREN